MTHELVSDKNVSLAGSHLPKKIMWALSLFALREQRHSLVIEHDVETAGQLMMCSVGRIEQSRRNMRTISVVCADWLVL